MEPCFLRRSSCSLLEVPIMKLPGGIHVSFMPMELMISLATVWDCTDTRTDFSVIKVPSNATTFASKTASLAFGTAVSCKVISFLSAGNTTGLLVISTGNCLTSRATGPLQPMRSTATRRSCDVPASIFIAESGESLNSATTGGSLSSPPKDHVVIVSRESGRTTTDDAPLIFLSQLLSAAYNGTEIHLATLRTERRQSCGTREI